MPAKHLIWCQNFDRLNFPNDFIKPQNPAKDVNSSSKYHEQLKSHLNSQKH